MRIGVCAATLSTVSILVLGGSGLVGCGSVSTVEPDGGGSGGGGAGTSGRGGSGSGGTTGSGGSAGGTGAGGAAGAGGSVVGGRGGTDAGGSGGSSGSGGSPAGGRGGTDASGRGGAAAGGRGGGSAGSGGSGNGGTGGVATGGRGGNAGSGGAGGIAGIGGNVSIGGRGGGTAGSGGGSAGTGGAAGCARGACPALTITDLTAIDDSKAPGFDAATFRCKSLTICPVSGACAYFSTATIFGSLQSAEDAYSDGTAVGPAAVRMSIAGGAMSQCNNPPITFTADEFLTLTVEGGKKVPVYLPAFTGVSLTLYIASDGSTYSDAALTQPARLRPP